MSAALAALAEIAVTVLKPVAAACSAVSRPFARVWRVAWLRSQSDGAIPISTQFDGPVHTAGRVRLDLGDHCRLGRETFFETCGGSIRLGERVRINAGGVFVSYASVTIGNDCLIGEYVSVRDADHGTQPGTPMRTQPHVSAPIVIGDNVWIARGAVILKGVTIGSGAVVAANSVVNRDVEADSIVGGVPARLLRMRSQQAGVAR
jgi:acetyltransferase-like isoleucine patch superfamily enzyme